MTLSERNHRTNSVLLIGGRDAGKSNYLFRLWLGIDDGRGLLVKNGLPEQLDYLQAGAEEILQGNFAERTAPASLESVTVPIKSRHDSTRIGDLIVPDAPGEQVLKVYKTRQWPEIWENHVENGCACLLFMRADSAENIAPLDWATCFERCGMILDEPLPASNRGEPPTQAVLTEWLQLLRTSYTATVGGNFRPRIGIVVSAWDSVPPDQQLLGPSSWVLSNFPMLGQFVETNHDEFQFEVFGVSIVSGDLKGDEEFKKKFADGRPQDFGMVCHTLKGTLDESSDITLPVAWALNYPLEVTAN